MKKQTLTKIVVMATLIMTPFALIAANSNQLLNYSGRIVNPKGQAVESAQVVYTLSIYSPAPSSCLLYQETQTLNMQNSKGVFSLSIGSGTRTDGKSHSFSSIFVNNSSSPITGLDCTSGSTYTPSSTDDRTLKVDIKDEGTTVGSVEIPIKSVPFALQASEIGGYGIDELLKVSDGGPVAGITTAQWNRLVGLAEGNTSVDLNNQKITNVGTPAAATDAATKGYVDTQISSVTSGNITGVAGLTNTKIWVGDASGKAQEMAVSGDATLAANGALTLASVGSAGTYTKVTVDAKGRVTGNSSLAAGDIPNLDWSKITSGKPTTLGGYGITDSVQNAGSVPSVQAGALASRPAAGTAGRIYLDTTNYVLYQDDGAIWHGIGSAGSVTSVGASAPLASSGGATPTISLSGAVDAAHGGTGQTSLTSGSLLVGNGTGTVNFLASGASGNVMYGTGASTWASGTPDTAGLVDKTSIQTIAGAKTFSDAVTVNNTLTTASFKVTGGTPGSGKLLTSDATGNATWQTPATNGTVTSVGLSMPAELTITNSPVTGSGTLTGTWASQAAKKVLAAPQGSAGTPGFRLMNIADIQSVNTGDFLTGTTCSAGQALTYSAISDTISCNAITLAVTNTASLANTKIWVGDASGKAQEMAVSGDATLAADGALTLASVGSAGTYTKVTVDAKGRVTGNSSLAAGDIPNLDWSKITSGKPTTLGGYGITDSVQNAGSVPSVQAGALASRPAAGTAGRIYLDTTNYVLYQDDGATWQGIGSAGSVTSVGASAPLASSGGATPTISLSGAVDAAHGGTGQTSLTSGSLLVGNGTGTVNFLASGASGNVMYGTGASTWASGTPDTAGLVDKTSAQTIAGAKTFSDAVTVNNTLTTASFKVTGGTPGSGKLLTSDATGNATWQTPATNGTVTSVGLSMPAELTITNSPVTGSGTLTGTWASQAAKKVLAAPQGSAGTPGFRLMNIADIQSVNTGDFLTGTTCSAGQALTYSAISDTISCNAITLAVTNTASLANTKIWVGDASGKAQEMAVSGDATLAANGALTLASVGSAGTYTKVTVDAKGRVTGNSSLAAGDIPNLDWSKITSGKPTTLGGYGITDSVQNAGSVPSVQAGALASRPAAGTAGRIYLDTTNYVLYQDDGATWQGIGSAGSVTSVGASAPLASSGGATPTISLSGAVDAAHGGTGQTSLTSGSLLVGNGTGTVNFLASGASGNVMYGTGASTWASGTPDTAGLVDKASTQTIAGAKTFSNAVTVNNSIAATSMLLNGSSSGTLTQTVPATVTSYTMTWPNAKATSASQILASDTSGNLSWIDFTSASGTIDLSSSTKITGALPISKGGTNSSTALTNNQLMFSNSGAIQELGAMTDGQLVVGKTGFAPQIVSMSGDVTINNTGTTTVGKINNTTVSGVGLSNNNVLQNNSGSSIVGNSVLVSNGTATGVTNLSTPVSGVLISSGSVPTWSNLTTDNFTQYVLLAGRSGGQSITGGTAASENLTLDSTSNGTKGYVLLNPTSGNVGIGNSAPAATLDVSGTLKANSYVEPTPTFVNSGAGYTIPDLTRTVRRVTLDNNTTITLPTQAQVGALPSATSFSLTIKVKQDGTGSRTLAFAAGSGMTLKWDQSASTPTPATAASKETIYQFTTFQDETIWYGMMVWQEN